MGRSYEKYLQKSDAVSDKKSAPKREKGKSYSQYLVDSIVAQDEIEQQQRDSAGDLALLAAQGASQDWLDEAVGGVKSLVGGDYTEERDKFRQSIEGARDRQGIAGDVAELGGNVAVSMIPGMRVGTTVGKELALAAFQGMGAADEAEDMPAQALKSTIASGVAQGAGKVASRMFFNEPDKILARTTGANRKNFFDAKDGPKAPHNIRKRLDDKGFYRQGEVIYDLGTRKWVPNPTKSRLETFFKPQSLEDLHTRAETAITALKGENERLLKNRMIPMNKVMASIQQAAMDFIPDGFDYIKREKAANEIVDKIMFDMANKNMVQNGMVRALDLETIKRQMSDEVFNTFHKSADDLALTPESLRYFRTKIDDLLDSVGGKQYKENNDLMSDLLTQNEQIFQKVSRESAEGVEKPNLTRGSLTDRVVDMINPAPVGVARARIGKAIENNNPWVEGIRKTFKRAPVEIINNNVQPQVEVIENDPGHPMNNRGRMPQSVPNIPEQLIRTPLPRNTSELMQKKNFVLAKVAQMMPEMFEAVKDTYEHEPERLGEIAQVLAMKMPHVFERDKYNRFDGRILSEADKQKAIKDTLLRQDISSIEQAKIITRLNKEGLYDG